MPVNFVPFAESVIDLMAELYRNTAKYPSVIHAHVLLHIIHVSGADLIPLLFTTIFRLTYVKLIKISKTKTAMTSNSIENLCPIKYQYF